MKNEDILTGKTLDNPQILWDEEDKYAIIIYLLLSLEKKAGKDELARFDDLFGLTSTKPEETAIDEDENVNKLEGLAESRETIIRECEKFLAELDEASRYDCIVDEIDRFIEGGADHDSTCVIGSSYANFGKDNKLDGGAYWLFDLVKLVIADADYSGNKKRLIKHLARKWNVEATVLTMLEKSAKTFLSIRKARAEIEASDKPYHEAVKLLNALDIAEKEAWRELNNAGVAKDKKTSAYVAAQNRVSEAIENLTGKPMDRLKPNDTGEVSEEDDDDEEPDFWDEVADKAVSGIQWFFGGIADAIENATLTLDSRR
ncbi:hypothetical protein [Treponema primitia]|uniref:hypothetical protein n=1 Tax=Treponema primitia TaxID=88058 RepID=UPI0018E0F4DA|nr:hypothetical protein [Treponema primitia]